jgi:predicted DNA-binding ribbon-helix-helix protein
MSTKHISFRAPAAYVEILQEIADVRSLSISALLAEILADYAENQRVVSVPYPAAKDRKTIASRIPAPLRQKLATLAEISYRDLSSFLEWLVAMWLRQQGKI